MHIATLDDTQTRVNMRTEMPILWIFSIDSHEFYHVWRMIFVLFLLLLFLDCHLVGSIQR